MNEADIKLQLIRLIDKQQGDQLQQLYEVILNHLSIEPAEVELFSDIELGYKKMSEDVEREADAIVF